MTYWLASLVLPRPFALTAAALVALDPASVIFANQLLTESLFTLLLTLGVGLVVSSWKSGSAITASIGGLTLGMAVLVRPVGESCRWFSHSRSS